MPVKASKALDKINHSRMLALEEYMAQHDQADHDQPQKDKAVRCHSPRLATCSVGRSQESTSKEGDGHVSETVRRKQPQWQQTSTSAPTVSTQLT